MPRPPTDLERLRAWRVRPPRDGSIAPVVEELQRTAQKARSALGHVWDAWSRTAPAECVAATSIAGISRGTLTIRVSDSPTRVQLDRWLRAGGSGAVIRACPIAVRAVKLVL